MPPRAVPFLTAATERLHAYGTPAHRLERVVGGLGARFGLSVQVFSTPTSIFLGVRDADGGPEAPETVHLLRVEPGGVDLGHLVDLDDLLDEVMEGRETPAGPLRGGAPSARARPRGPVWVTPAAFALSSTAAAVFFGGNLHELAASAVLGAVIAAIEPVASRNEGAAGLFEPVAAFVAAAGALAAARLTGGRVDDGVVALASIIVLLPGLSLTVAFIELATRHLASGTARLFGAMTVFLTIAFGALLGRIFVSRALGEPAAPPLEPGGAHDGAEWLGSLPAVGLAVLGAAIGFSVLFRVRRSEFTWVLGGCAVGFGVARAVGDLASRGAETFRDVTEAASIGAFAGALCLGLFANGFARFKRLPATVPLVPGLIVLVPGSVGYRALSAFTEQDALSGLESAFQMLLIAAALVGGLLTANAVLPPRRVL